MISGMDEAGMMVMDFPMAKTLSLYPSVVRPVPSWDGTIQDTNLLLHSIIKSKMVAKAKCALGSIEPGRHA